MAADQHRLPTPVCDSLSEMPTSIAMPPMDGTTGRLDRNAREILLNVLAQIEAFSELDASLAEGPDQYPSTMRSMGVPYQPNAWFAKPLDDARRQAYSRATKQLERAGLIQRVTEPDRNRVTHLLLTPAGLRCAMELAGPHADRMAVAKGLWLTNWGRDLATHLFAKSRPYGNEATARE